MGQVSVIAKHTDHNGKFMYFSIVVKGSYDRKQTELVAFPPNAMSKVRFPIYR